MGLIHGKASDTNLKYLLNYILTADNLVYKLYFCFIYAQEMSVEIFD